MCSVAHVGFYLIFFLMIRRPPRSTRTDTLFPYTTLFRSAIPPIVAGILSATNRCTHCRGDVPLSSKTNPAESHCCSQRSEEHTSELQSLMRISYAVFCLKKKKTPTDSNSIPIQEVSYNKITQTQKTVSTNKTSRDKE